MTVYQSVAEWLMNIVLPKVEKNANHTVVDIEVVPDWATWNNAGIFNSPNEISTPMMGGQEKRTEFKSFYIRRPFTESSLAQDFQDRLGNENYMEKLRDVIYEMNLDCDFPQDNRQWESVSINGGIYPAQKAVGTLGREAFYLVPLRLVYIK